MGSSLASLQKRSIYRICLGTWRLGLLWHVSLPWRCAIRISSLTSVEVSASVWKCASDSLTPRIALYVLTPSRMLWCINPPSFFSLILVLGWSTRVAFNRSWDSLLFSFGTFFGFRKGIRVVLILFGWSFVWWHIWRWLAFQELLLGFSIVPVSVDCVLLSLDFFFQELLESLGFFPYSRNWNIVNV